MRSQKASKIGRFRGFKYSGLERNVTKMLPEEAGVMNLMNKIKDK